MVRVLFETSLPARTLARVEAALEGSALPPGVVGRLELPQGAASCESPAQGGEVEWTPCWISLETAEPSPGFVRALRSVREAVVAAAREGKLEIFALPATARVGQTYLRFRDILDVIDHLPE